MSTAMATVPEQGQLVSVRSRNWIVNDVVPSTITTDRLSASPTSSQNLLSLSSIEDDGLGEQLDVIWELEPGARVIEKVALPEPTGFDSPDRLDAFLDAVRWGASSSADVRNIQSPFRSGIDIEDYQLDPVVRAIQMPRVNLLVADDVGLGKTIEAGMVALELIIRHRVRKILVVCPSALQVQWQEQMRDKFGLEFRIVDSHLMKQLRRQRGIHVNPWNHFPRLITSIDFLKRERPIRLFRETLPGPNDPIYPRKYDLLILDESHNCAPSGRGRYATDSLRTQAIQQLAPHFEHKLFLTATPHNGYRATQKWLMEVLAAEKLTGGDRLMTMFGGMDSKEREAVKAAFQAAPEVSPVRILLATDAASEGLDLQNHCYRLIHYEIPWNPNRMEQRNGRFDRHGQKGFVNEDGERLVFVYHFVAEGYKQRAKENVSSRASDLDADLEFLMRVAQKVETIREDLGSYGTVLADDVEAAMLGQGYTLAATDAAGTKAEPVRKMLRFERDLKKHIDGLLEQYRETERELRLTPANRERVVEVALNLADQPCLSSTDEEHVYRLPALKGSWALCVEGLEHPHTKQVRPITFDENLSKGRDDIVLAHLNHRLVQMSLRLLRAEIWKPQGQKRLHRITAQIVPDNVLNTPAVIGHARLVVIGGDSHRLHEEIITAGGFIREGRFNRMNVGQVADTFAAATCDQPSAKVRKTLLGMWDKLASPLAQALTARMDDRATGLEKKLAERADKEAADIESILSELKRTIEAELNEPEYRQLELFDNTERQQFELNKDAMRARAKEIPDEIVRETAALRARYAAPEPRMFPVAVTFLVPTKLSK